jgi:hypothetical protein
MGGELEQMLRRKEERESEIVNLNNFIARGRRFTKIESGHLWKSHWPGKMLVSENGASKSHLQETHRVVWDHAVFPPAIPARDCPLVAASHNRRARTPPQHTAFLNCRKSFRVVPPKRIDALQNRGLPFFES